MLNSDETLTQKFVKKGFWLYFFTFLIGPIGYIIKMITSHDLSVAELGMIYGVMGFISLAGAFNDLGCTESLNYFLPKYIIKKEYGKAKYLIHITFLVQFISSISIAILLFFIAPWLATMYFGDTQVTPLLQIAGLYFIGINLFHIGTVFFSVSQDTRLQKSVDLFRLLVVLTGAIGLLVTHTGDPRNYMWIWIIGIGIGCIASLYLAYTRYYSPYFSGIPIVSSSIERRHFFKYAGATMLTANIGMLLSQIDTQFIIIFLGSEATGYYTNYLSLLTIPFMFISPIVGFLFPVISELHGRSDTKKMEVIYRQFSLYFSIIGIWLGVFLFQFGEEFSVLFFGEKFRESGSILGYSSFFLIFNLLIQVNFQFLAGTGKIGDRARILMIVLPVNIILNLILIHFLGIEGSALAVGLSWIPLWYLSYRATTIHSSGFEWSPFIKNIILAGISFSILFMIMRLGIFQDATLLGTSIVEFLRDLFFFLPDMTSLYSFFISLSSRIGNFSIIFIAMIVNLIILWTGNLSIINNVVCAIRDGRK